MSSCGRLARKPGFIAIGSVPPVARARAAAAREIPTVRESDAREAIMGWSLPEEKFDM
jgi:hypothetical protein